MRIFLRKKTYISLQTDILFFAYWFYIFLKYLLMHILHINYDIENENEIEIYNVLFNIDLK